MEIAQIKEIYESNIAKYKFIEKYYFEKLETAGVNIKELTINLNESYSSSSRISLSKGKYNIEISCAQLLVSMKNLDFISENIAYTMIIHEIAHAIERTFELHFSTVPSDLLNVLEDMRI